MDENQEALTDAEIAGFMNWRGPGAYTAAAMRRVRRAIDEAVWREREACAKACETQADENGGQDYYVIGAMACAKTIRARKP